MLTNFTKRFTYSVLASALAFGCTPDMEQALPNQTLKTEEASSAVLDGSVNASVKFKAGHYIIIGATTLPTDLESQVRSLKGNVTGMMQEVAIATVTSSDPDFAAKAGKIKGVSTVIRDLDVQWFNPADQKTMAFDAEAKYGNPPFSRDDDNYFDLQWGHDAVNAPEAWNAGARGKGVRVAVLDSGFDTDHPDLVPNIDFKASRNFVTGEQLQYALSNKESHGTHTAGIIAAADNGTGIIGVAPEAELILVKVIGDAGASSFSWILQGIIHATNEGADVINMSFGATLPRNGKYLYDNGTPDDTSDDYVISDTKATQELINMYTKVTNYAANRGVTLIASAGNDANNGNKDQSWTSIPSGAPSVITISATAPQGWALNPLTTNLDNLASYSNYGTSDIDFAAPGGDFSFAGINPTQTATIAGQTVPAFVFDYVFSTGSSLVPGKGSYFWSVGTSMAAPHAAGVAALIIGQNGGEMDPAKVKAIMRASADDLGKPGRDPYYGYGRLNAFKAITAIQ